MKDKGVFYRIIAILLISIIGMMFHSKHGNNVLLGITPALFFLESYFIGYFLIVIASNAKKYLFLSAPKEKNIQRELSPSKEITQTLLGILFLYFNLFIVMHIKFISIQSLLIASHLIPILLSASGIITFIKRRQGFYTSCLDIHFVVLLFVAFIFSYYVFLLYKLPGYTGVQFDIWTHWIGNFQRILKSGLPLDVLFHYGVPLIQISSGFGLATETLELLVNIKILTMIMIWLFLASIFVFIKQKLPNIPAYICVFSALFFSPIDLTPFFGGGIGVTSYYKASFAGISSGYSNMTLLFSLPFFTWSFLLFYRSIEKPSFSSLLLSFVFLSGSFFFKPSGYTVFAPIYCFMLLFLPGTIKQKIGLICIILVPLIFWNFYASLFEIHLDNPGIVWAPLNHIYGNFLGMVSKGLLFDLSKTGFLIYTIIVSCIYLSFLIVRLIEILRSKIGKNRKELLLKIVLIISTFFPAFLVGLLFTTRVNPSHGNLFWLVASSNIAIFPVAFRCIWQIGNRAHYFLANFLLLCHVLSGLTHFILVVFNSRIS